jgi:hypothetical protein
MKRFVYVLRDDKYIKIWNSELNMGENQIGKYKILYKSEISNTKYNYFINTFKKKKFVLNYDDIIINTLKNNME